MGNSRPLFWLALCALAGVARPWSASAPPPADVWRGTAASFTYAVSLANWSAAVHATEGRGEAAPLLYRITVAPPAVSRQRPPPGTGVAGATLLSGLPPRVHCFGRWHSVTDGSLVWTGARTILNASHDVWGPYNAANVSWALQPSGMPFYTAVLRLASSDTLLFQQVYGGACDNANVTEGPSNRSATLYPGAHASLNPSAEFPAFAAPEGGPDVADQLLTSPGTGFFTTGGVMTYGAMRKGFGLKGFTGGQQGGPLVLFDGNTTRRSFGLVLSPGDHFTSSVLGLHRTCSDALWRRTDAAAVDTPTPTLVSHVDFSRNDLDGINNITKEQCAAACIASPMCNAFTWGPGGCDRKHCRDRCYLKSSTLGNQSSSLQTSGYFCADRPQDTRLVAGPQGYVRAVPAGTAFHFLLAAAPRGGSVSAAVDGWGQTLRTAYRLRRSPRGAADPVGHSLGYFTDNGAVYDGRDPLGTANMSRLFAALRGQAVPVRYLQLDPYWYGDNTAWLPREDLYGPDGLAGLTRAIDPANRTRLLLYHTYWSRYSQGAYTRIAPQANFTFVPSHTILVRGASRTIFQIRPEQAGRFFGALFRQYRGVMMGAEVDFLDWQQLAVPELFSVLDAGEEYLAGLAAAARALGVSHQLCMALPSQVMASLALPAVTNARASPDNTPTNEERWRIGYTSLIMAALDVQPFFDNVWTEAVEPAEPYGPGVSRNNVQLQYMLALLTAGPVGLGDEIGRTNATRALQGCTANGTLLQPDRPATPIDAMFSLRWSQGPSAGGEVWQSHTVIGGLMWRYVVAVDVAGFPLYERDLWPEAPGAADRSPSAGPARVVMAWHSRWACGQSNTTARCATAWDAASAPLTVRTAASVGHEHGFEMYTAAPVLWSPAGTGVALLGEKAKVVSVSAARFTRVAPSGGAGLNITLAGAPSERVEVLYCTLGSADAAPAVHSIAISLDAHGTATADLR